MNQKKAKKLRRLSETVSRGLPEADYQTNSKYRRRQSVELKPRCTRAVYHELKRRASE